MLCKAFRMIRFRLRGAARAIRLQKALLYPLKSVDLPVESFKMGLNIKMLVMDETISPMVSPKTAKAICDYFDVSMDRRKHNFIKVFARICKVPYPKRIIVALRG